MKCPSASLVRICPVKVPCGKFGSAADRESKKACEVFGTFSGAEMVGAAEELADAGAEFVDKFAGPVGAGT